MLNLLKRFIDKAQAFRVSLQAGRARDLAQAKAIRKPRRAKPDKKSYKPGKLGLSTVSQAIQKDYGEILIRSERKRVAKEQGTPFKAYYNGNGLIPTKHNAKPSKYATGRR